MCSFLTQSLPLPGELSGQEATATRKSREGSDVARLEALHFGFLFSSLILPLPTDKMATDFTLTIPAACD